MCSYVLIKLFAASQRSGGPSKLGHFWNLHSSLSNLTLGPLGSWFPINPIRFWGRIPWRIACWTDLMNIVNVDGIMRLSRCGAGANRTTSCIVFRLHSIKLLDWLLSLSETRSRNFSGYKMLSGIVVRCFLPNLIPFQHGPIKYNFWWILSDLTLSYERRWSAMRKILWWWKVAL